MSISKGGNKSLSSAIKLLGKVFTNVAGSLKRKSIFLKDFIWHKPKFNQAAVPQCQFQYVPRIHIEKELKNLKRNIALESITSRQSFKRLCRSNFWINMLLDKWTSCRNLKSQLISNTHSLHQFSSPVQLTAQITIALFQYFPFFPRS